MEHMYGNASVTWTDEQFGEGKVQFGGWEVMTVSLTTPKNSKMLGMPHDFLQRGP